MMFMTNIAQDVKSREYGNQGFFKIPGFFSIYERMKNHPL